MDQAETLRRRYATRSATPRPKVLAITSGKGGVGKTNVVANTAVALAGIGQRVLVLDADLGLGNLDVLFGLAPTLTLDHVLAGQSTLDEVLIQGPGGIRILPASSGVADFTALSDRQRLILLSEFDRLEADVDVLLIDTGAGISPNVRYFSSAAEEIVVVASTEPTSLTDAYAVMKVLSTHHDEKRFRLLVNMVGSDEDGREVFRRLSRAADRFLDVSIDYVGSIPDDDYLREAVAIQRAVMDAFPHAPSSLAFIRLARSLLSWPAATTVKGSGQLFLRRLVGAEAASVGE